MNFSYRDSISQILYGDCKTIRIKGRTLVVQYKDGKKEKFYYIAGKEIKKIKALLKTAPLESDQSQIPQRSHLCPKCTSMLIKGQYVCPECSLVFKNKSQARKFSIIYPGGGYFYTRHPFLGLGDAFVELYLTALIVAVFIAAIGGAQDATFALVFFGIVLTMEKMITIFHSNSYIEEYIPKNHNITTNTVLADTEEPPQESEKQGIETILSLR